MPTSVSVGNIHSDFIINLDQFDAGLNRADQRVAAHGRTFGRTAANIESALNRVAIKARAPAGSLDALNNRLTTLNLRMSRTDAGSVAFSRLAARAAVARARIDEVSRAQARFNARAARGSGVAGSVGGALSAIGLGAGAAVGAVVAAGAAAVAAAGKILQLGGRLQTTRVAFTTLTGSAAKANEVINKLVSDSNKSPFTADQYLQAGQSLIALGESTENLSPVLRRIGDIAAGTGKNFNELATIYGKARVQGRLMGEDVNQILESRIPLIQELAKQFGISEGEVKKLVSTGAVSFAHLERAFINLTKEGSKFGGMMAAQSKTLPGMISTIVGNTENLAAKLGEALIPLLTPFLEGISDGLMRLQELSDWLKTDFGADVLSATGSILRFIAAVNPITGPFILLIRVWKLLTGAFAEFQARVGPWLVLLNEQVSLLAKRFKPIGDVFVRIGKALSEAFGDATEGLSWFKAGAIDAFFDGVIYPVQIAIRLVRAIDAALGGVGDVFYDLGAAARSFLDVLRIIANTKIGKMPDPVALKEAWGDFKRSLKDVETTGKRVGDAIKEAWNTEFLIKETKKFVDALKKPPPPPPPPPPGRKPPSRIKAIKPPKVEWVGFVTAANRAFAEVAASGQRAMLRVQAASEEARKKMIAAQDNLTDALVSGDEQRIKNAQSTYAAAATEFQKLYAKAQKDIKKVDAALPLEQRWAKFMSQTLAHLNDFISVWSNVMGRVSSLLTTAASQRVESMQRSQDRMNWMMEAYTEFAQQQYDQEVDAFEAAEEQKTEILLAAQEERRIAADEEFERKKLELEAELEQILLTDEESRARRQQEIEDGTVNEQIETSEIALVDEDARKLKEKREKDHEARLAALRDEIDAREKARQTEVDAAAAKRETDTEQRREAMTLQREQREKNSAKTIAFIQWLTESAMLHTKGQADAQAAIISGITGAAQAFAGIVAAMTPGGPIAIAIGVGLGAAISATILAQAFSAATAARSQTILPPLSLVFAAGGVLSSTIGTPGMDSVPAMLMPGETVIDTSRTDKMQSYIDNLTPANRAGSAVDNRTIFEAGALTFNIARNDSESQAEEIFEYIADRAATGSRSQRGIAAML